MTILPLFSWPAPLHFALRRFSLLCWKMPLKARYDSKTLEVYSPQPSDLKLLIVVENWFLTIALNMRNLEQTSNLLTSIYKSTHSRCAKCAKCQIFVTLSHLAHQTQKIPPIRCYICVKIIPFVFVPLQICNGTDTNAKLKYCFLFGFLSRLTSDLDFFSLFSHQTQLLPQQRKNKMTHSTSSNNKLQGKVAIITGGATAWARPLWSSPSSSLLWSSWSLSLSLFWWLVVLIVGGWLILVGGGRLIGLWVWDLGWVWDFGWS